jgi:Flp pilus assembly pilin Flp
VLIAALNAVLIIGAVTAVGANPGVQFNTVSTTLK